MLKTEKKETVLKLRWLIIILISYLLLFGRLDLIQFNGIDVLIFLFLLSNFLLYFLPERYFSFSFFDYFVVCLDTIFIVFGIYLSGSANTNFFAVFFLVVLLSAFLPRVRELLIFTCIFGCFYVFFALRFQFTALSWRETLSVYLRIPFLLTIAIFNGHLVKIAKGEKLKHKKAERDKREIQEQARMMSVINEVSNALTTTLEIQELCKIISAEMPKLFPFDEAGLFILPNSDHEYIFFPLNNLDRDIFLPYLKKDDGESLIRKVFENKKVVFKQDLAKVQLLTEEKEMQERDIHSYLLAPLVAKQEVRGFLYFGSIIPNCFSAKDYEVVKQIGGQIVMSLENAMLHKKIKKQSVTDGLTGLFNHSYFYQQLQAEIKTAAARGTSLSLLFLDLDFFKRFNDLNGHLLGDKALKEVAGILKNCQGSEDLAARYGGEEFVLLCPGKDAAQAEKLAEKILHQIKAFPFKIRHGVHRINQLTISIGIANFPEDGIDCASLIASADRALFQAKKGGRNQFQQTKRYQERERKGAEADCSYALK